MSTTSSKIRAGLFTTNAVTAWAVGETKSRAPIGAGAASHEGMPRGAPRNESTAWVWALSATSLRSRMKERRPSRPERCSASWASPVVRARVMRSRSAAKSSPAPSPYAWAMRSPNGVPSRPPAPASMRAERARSAGSSTPITMRSGRRRTKTSARPAVFAKDSPTIRTAGSLAAPASASVRLQHLAQSGAAHLREHERDDAAPGAVVHDGQDHLVAQVIGHGPDVLDHAGEARPAVPRGVGLGPQAAQHGALVEPLVEEPVGVAQGLAVVGQAGEDDGLLGQQPQQAALVAQLRPAHLPPALAQHLQLPQQGQVPVRLAAPGDLALHGNAAHGRAGGPLLARSEHGLVAAAGDADLALDHGDARSLEAAVHGEHGARDLHVAVAGGHTQVARAAPGGSHDDAAAGQVDRGVGAFGGDCDLRPLAHLHQRAVAQPQHGARVAGGADGLRFPDLLARRQRHRPLRGDELQGAGHRLHGGPAARGRHLAAQGPEREAGHEQDGRGHGVARDASRWASGFRRRARTPRQQREPALAGQRGPAARAVAQVVVHEQGTGGRQRVPAMGVEEPAHVVAAPDRLGGREVGGSRSDPLPHPRRGALGRTRGRGVVAHRRHRVVQRHLLSFRARVS